MNMLNKHEIVDLIQNNKDAQVGDVAKDLELKDVPNSKILEVCDLSIVFAISNKESKYVKLISASKIDYEYKSMDISKDYLAVLEKMFDKNA